MIRCVEKVSRGSLFLFSGGRLEQIEARIRSLVEPIAEELGLEVLKVSLGGGRHSQLLRIIVDRAGGVDSDDLERISRGLSLQMDAADVIAGRYRLEVTSPGLDWPLQEEADFRRYQGEWIRVSFADGRSLEGTNLGPVDGGFRLADAGGGEQTVSMNEVNKVVRAVNWKEVSRKQKKQR